MSAKAFSLCRARLGLGRGRGRGLGRGPRRVLAVAALGLPGADRDELSIVYKFGGSSVADASRIREVADIVCAFPDNAPAVVVSACVSRPWLGKHTRVRSKH